MIIGIDFDGTCVTHEFPNIGKDIGAVPVLKKLIDAGHQLILFTMRSNVTNPKSESSEILEQSGDYLNDAIDWFIKHEITIYGINENPSQKSWTSSPKPYCHVYIDDAALGCPLIYDAELSDRPFVNWKIVEQILKV
jgi:hypothetical protein